MILSHVNSHYKTSTREDGMLNDLQTAADEMQKMRKACQSFKTAARLGESRTRLTQKDRYETLGI